MNVKSFGANFDVPEECSAIWQDDYELVTGFPFFELIGHEPTRNCGGCSFGIETIFGIEERPARKSLGS